MLATFFQPSYNGRMATNNGKHPGGRPRKLKKSDPGFFSKIGGKGGTATRDNHGANYFSRLAKLSHVRRRERLQQVSVPQESGAAE